jgi:alkylation response protein AidB-like acyl-CoA dehydrogenase
MTPGCNYPSIAHLEAFLGDPRNPSNPFSFDRAVRLDEHEEYPEEAAHRLNEWGLAHFFVPGEYGGRLGDIDECIGLIRVVSRRDLTLAVAQGKTFLGTVAVWTAGTDLQKRVVADAIVAGAQAALALTEEAHGADLRASDVHAREVEGGYLLSGTKWLINNGTRARFLTLLAALVTRNGERTGPCLFLIDKHEIDRNSFRHVDKIPTHGIRGADISGIEFRECKLPAHAVLGRKTDGLRTLFKCMFVTRTLCAGLSLGAADTAFRTAFGFALQRQLYGGSAVKLPYVRRLIAQSLAIMLVCEAVSTAAARSLHTTPSQASVWSSVVKYFVPTMIERVLQDLATVLGARHYLRMGCDAGIFQKILRDNAVVSFFDGSTGVNLNNIVFQMYPMSVGRSSRHRVTSLDFATRFGQIFSVAQPLPDLRVGDFALVSRGESDVFDGLALLLQQSDESQIDHGLAATRPLAGELLRLLEKLDVGIVNAGRAEKKSGGEHFELAKRFCTLHALIAAIATLAFSRRQVAIEFQDGEWLLLAARTLADKSLCGTAAQSDDIADRLICKIEAKYRSGESLSLFARCHQEEMLESSGEVK